MIRVVQHATKHLVAAADTENSATEAEVPADDALTTSCAQILEVARRACRTGDDDQVRTMAKLTVIVVRVYTHCV